MPDLEMLLREVRPAPDPQWAMRLDARVAARFPGPPPRWKQPLIALREHLMAIGAFATVASLVVVFVIAVANDSGDDSANSASGGSGKVEAMATPAAESADSGGSGASKAAPAAIAPLSRDARSVKTTTSITLTTTPDQVQTVSDRAIRVVDNLGGFVKTSEIDSAGSRATATLSLRIPSAKVDDGLAQISKLAHVSARSQQTEDLTDQRALLEARVRDARADRAGLRARLAKATTDKERSHLRALLDRATRRVTARQRDVAALGQEVAYATVDLNIEGRKRSGATAVPGDRWTPGDALGDAGRVLEVIAGVLLIALAILLPIVLIGVFAILAARLLTRRRRHRALEMA